MSQEILMQDQYNQYIQSFYHDGVFDEEAFQRNRINHLHKEAYGYIQNEQWEDLFDLAMFNRELIPLAMEYYDFLPNDKKSRFVINTYQHNGYYYPKIRKAVRTLLKYCKPIIPDFIADKNVITVYRAGEEPIDKAHNRISWTRSKKVAYRFLNDLYCRHAKYLYQAKIKTKDIIAYSNDRKEQEVMQYRKVYDVRLIDTISNPKASI